MQDAVRGAHSLHTSGLSSVARAALTSFGFVYLHPMTDGNGRISRFLINDVLRRDGALPAQVQMGRELGMNPKKLGARAQVNAFKFAVFAGIPGGESSSLRGSGPIDAVFGSRGCLSHFWAQQVG